MKITTDNLGKRFNREWIFKNLSLTFESGNTYAITGPNGSGKSTLIQILWGQLPPTTGSIVYRYDDMIIPGDEIFNHLTIATPYMDLIDEFTLAEMVAFHFKFKKTLNDVSLQQLLDKMELSHARDKQISNFSSGMKQRLKLALALFTDARILFLDEPSTNLDSNALDWYRRQLADLAGRLVIIASNQSSEYPENSVKIQLQDFKTGVTKAK